MKNEVPFYNIFMYLYNKNILEYAQIAGSAPKSMILNVEGRIMQWIYYLSHRMEIRYIPGILK